MWKPFPSFVCLASLAIACDGGNRPVSFGAPSPVPTSAPAPPSPFAESYTQITVGEVVSRRVAADAPECFGLPGWPCQHFRLTAPSDGRLELAMTYAMETQPTQGVDVSVIDSEGREWWADFFSGPLVRASAPVRAGATYQITLWYTFPGLEFELRSSLQAN